jgi:hypothetical protein
MMKRTTTTKGPSLLKSKQSWNDKHDEKDQHKNLMKKTTITK